MRAGGRERCGDPRPGPPEYVHADDPEPGAFDRRGYLPNVLRLKVTGIDKRRRNSIIKEHFLPNTQWTCTGTMANGDYWTVNTFNASADDKRTAIVSLRSVPQYFATDTVIVNNSMSDDITRFQCNFSKI